MSQINNDKLYIKINYRHQESHKEKVQKDFVNLRYNKNNIRKYWLIGYLKCKCAVHKNNKIKNIYSKSISIYNYAI